jgi:hypothetical protein
LAGARWPARLHAVQIILSRHSIAVKVIDKAELLAHATAGLDPTGDLSRQLHKVEQNSDALGSLGETLAHLTMSSKLDAQDVKPLAEALVERMIAADSYAFGRLLASLSSKLDTQDVKPLVAALVERLKVEQDIDVFSALGVGLAGLRQKFNVQPSAGALVERLKVGQDSNVLVDLGETVNNLTSKLDAKDVQPLVAALVERLKVEQNSDAVSELGLALAGLSSKLDAQNVKPVVATLVERIKVDQGTKALSALGLALAGLSSNLGAKDAQPSAAALKASMKTRNDLEDIPRMVKAWVPLEQVAYANLDPRTRIQTYVDLLGLPLVVGDARKALLDGLDQLTGEAFEGDLWRFVDWATESDEGKALQLDLGGP